MHVCIRDIEFPLSTGQPDTLTLLHTGNICVHAISTIYISWTQEIHMKSLCLKSIYYVDA